MSMFIAKTKRIKQRSQTGFSLVTSLSVGLIGTLLIAAMFSTVLPSLSGVAKSKTDSALREAAESGLDYVTAQLAAGGDAAAPYTPSSKGGSVTVTLPPSTSSGSPLGDFAGIPVTASCTVSDIACPSSSYLYTFQLDPTSSGSSAQVSGSGNRWKVLTVKSAVSGRTNSPVRTLRAILRPNYTSVPTSTTTSSTQTTSGWPFRAIAASNNFTGNGGITTNSYNSATDGSNPSTFISKYADVMANGNAKCNATSGSIGGDLASAGDASNGNTTVSGSVVDNAAPLSFPPVPSHSSSAKQLTPTELSVKNGSTLKLAAGDYYVTADSKGNAVNVQGVLSVSGPVRLWVEGSSPSVTIKGLANTGNPANFQVFYNPSNPSTTESVKGSPLISIGGNGDFRGVIYAPNADIDVSGSSNYYGSIVGNDVTLSGGGSGGGIHYDMALMSTNILEWNETSSITTTTYSSNYAHSKCVSWQEL